MTNIFKSKKKEKEKQQKLDAFFAEYRELAFRHGLDFYASLQVTERGIIPVVKVRQVQDETGGS